MPLVSIIIPTYNREALILETINSVYKQTFIDYEVIVVDDGSTDKTVEVISTNFPDVLIFQQDHKGGGGAEARNFGIQRAQGRYIAFLDSDDIWFPHKLECQLSRLESDQNIMWIYSDAQVFNGNTGDILYLFSQLNSLHEGDVLQKLFLGDFIPFFTLIVKRTVFDHIGQFWTTPKGTDWDMCLRIAAYHPISVVREPLGRYRVHSSAITAKQVGVQAYQARIAIIERAITRDPQRLMALGKKARSRICIGTGKELARSGNLQQARKLFREAILLTPGSVDPYLYWSSSFLGKSLLGSMIKIKNRMRSKKVLHEQK